MRRQNRVVSWVSSRYDIGREHQQSFLAFHGEEERKRKSSCVVSKGCSATRWSYADFNDSGESQSEESVVK